MTSDSGRTFSDVSLRTESAASEPLGYIPKIVAANRVEWYPNHSDFDENDIYQAEIKNAVAAPRWYSDTSKNSELHLSRRRPREPSQQLPVASPNSHQNSRRVVPESQSNSYGLNMGSFSTSQAQPSRGSMVPFVSPGTQNTGREAPIRRATHQKMHIPSPQSLQPALEQRQQDQFQRRTSASFQSGGSQPTRDVYEGHFTEKFSTPPRNRTQMQSTVPVFNPVVSTTRPTVLSRVQQQQPGTDPIKRPSHGASRLSTDQQKRSTMSRDDYMSFPNDRSSDIRPMAFSPPFPNLPVGSPSMDQVDVYGPIPPETFYTIPGTSRPQFSTPVSPRSMIIGDSEPSDRLRERQNKPITPLRPTQVQAQQAGYPRSIQVPQSGPVMQMQSSVLHPTRQTLQQPSFDPRWQRFCEICRSNGSQASGFVCYHVSVSPLAIVSG